MLKQKPNSHDKGQIRDVISCRATVSDGSFYSVIMNSSAAGTATGLKTSKSQRVREFLPSFRPSYLSIFLAFVSGVLWLKNEAVNDRLFMLEKQVTSLTDGYRVFPLTSTSEHVPPTNEAKEAKRHRVISGIRKIVLEIIVSCFLYTFFV